MARLFQTLFLTASATRVFASCAYGTHLMPRQEGEVKVSTFGYFGSIGPLNWAALATPENNACATGTRQSPINMVDSVFEVISAADVTFEVNDMPDGAEFENLGTTVEVITQGGRLVLDNKEFALQQFHFHLPSEHLDNGTSQAMEMHMVHQAEDGQIAVVGVYINVATQAAAAAAAAAKRSIGTRSRLFGRQEEGAAPPAAADGSTPSTLLETIFSVVDQISVPGTKVKTPPLVMSEVVDAVKAGSFQAYSGSLTTPPCSEGVNWRVSTAKLGVTPESFIKVRDVIGFNSRFPQNTPGQPNILMISALGSAAAAVSAASGAGGAAAGAA